MNAVRYVWVYRGVYYSSWRKAYDKMNNGGPEPYPRSQKVIENGQRITYPYGFIDKIYVL